MGFAGFICKTIQTMWRENHLLFAKGNVLTKSLQPLRPFKLQFYYYIMIIILSVIKGTTKSSISLIASPCLFSTHSGTSDSPGVRHFTTHAQSAPAPSLSLSLSDSRSITRSVTEEAFDLGFSGIFRMQP